MDSSRSSLPNVDRANSTLFKRYLEEQHKSVVKTNNYQQISHPINSTIQITQTHRQQQQQQQHDAYASKYGNTPSHYQPVLIKRKSSNGRKTSGDSSKQRSSHTSRFMKRFQRQHKNGETTTNVYKRDSRPRFEFYNPSTTKQTRTDQESQCTCLVASDRNRAGDHHHHCSAKPEQVPRLSLNELFHSPSQHRRQPVQGAIALPPSASPLPMLPPTIYPPIRNETNSNLTYPMEQNPPPSPSIEPSSIVNTESETLILDPPMINLSNEYYPIINDFLQEISIEMTDKPNVDILLEIEESLAQRIYDCIIEHAHDGDDNDDTEHDTISYSTATNDSSVPAPVNKTNSAESNDLPPSPITKPTKDSTDNREKYFQPIREQPSVSFDNLLDRSNERLHSTPFNRLPKPIENSTDIRSPFTQSLFEPVNLLRTIHDDNDDFHFFPPSFSFNNSDLKLFPSSKSELSTTSYHQSVPFVNHLLPPRTTPIDTNLSAFKPIEPSNATQSTASFVLQRTPLINHHSTGVHWFGQS